MADGSQRDFEVWLRDFLATFDGLDGGVYVADMETYEVLYANGKVMVEFGPDIVGRKCYEVLQSGFDAPCPFCTNPRLVEDGRPTGPHVWEFRNTRNGRWYRCIDKAVRWPDGRLVRVEVALDITEARRIAAERDFRLRTESTLRWISMRLHHPEDLDAAIEEALAELGRLLGVSRAYVFEIYDEGRRITNTHEWVEAGVSPQKENLQDLDYTAFAWWKAKMESGEIIAVTDVDRVPEPERTTLREQDILSVLAVPLYAANRLFGLMGFDETRRRRAWTEEDIGTLQTAAEIIAKEITRSRSDARYEALFAGGHDAIFVLGPDRRILDANEAARRLTGQTQEELLARPFCALVEPDDRERVAAGPPPGPLASESVMETRIRRKDGAVREVVLSAAWVRAGGERLLQVFARDVTDRKRAERERERLRQALAQAQRLEAVGRLAEGIAHDVNNILGGISACVALLRGDPPTGAGRGAHLDTIDACVDRAADLTRSLLAFARAQPVSHRPVDLPRVLKRTLAIVRPTFVRAIRIETRVASGLPPVQGDEGQLVQCLLNLCINARDAMSEGGTLGIELAGRELARGDLLPYPDRRPGRYAVLTVSDTGVGIAPAHIPHVFDPFFTTKDKSANSGLGLSTLYGIVRSHGGFVDVESELGRGTRFSIHLPAAPVAAEAADRAPAAADGRPEGAR